MRPRDMALACLVSVIWGLTFVVIPFGLENFSVPQLTALRFVVAAIPVLFLPRPQVSWVMLLLIGLTLFTGQFLLLFFAYTQGLPPGIASVTQQMQAFFTVFLAAVFLRDLPGKTQMLGLGMAFCGLGLIALTVGTDLRSAGLAMALGGAFSWAIGNVLVKRLGSLPMLPFMAWLSLVPPIPCLLVSWLVNPTGASLTSSIAHASYGSLLPYCICAELLQPLPTRSGVAFWHDTPRLWWLLLPCSPHAPAYWHRHWSSESALIPPAMPAWR